MPESYKSNKRNERNGDDGNTNKGRFDDIKEAYGAYREANDVNNSAKTKKDQQRESSKKAAKVGAKAAANYFAPGVGGKVVDAASKTKLGNAVLNKGADVLNKIPGMAKTLKKADDKGITDKADQAVGLVGGDPKSMAPKAGNLAKKAKDGTSSKNGANDNSSSDSDNKSKKDNNKLFPKKNKNGKLNVTGFFNSPTKLLFIAGAGLIFILMLSIVSIVSGSSSTTNVYLNEGLCVQDDSDNIKECNNADSDAKNFYARVKEVKNEYSQNGKSFDPLYIVGFYLTLSSSNNAYVNYDTLTKAKIKEIVDAMFKDDSNTFDEDTFKKNLKEKILPSYLPDASESKYNNIIEEIFDYVENFKEIYSDSNSSGVCASSGTCVYEIDGFSVGGKKTSKKITVNNLMVRLMESGSGDEHSWGGTWGKPMEGEDLVPFEDYILGVAFGEIGTSYNDEAIKANLIMARSFSLARPTAMNNSGGKKLEQENNQWILQISGSTADHVYCNPDKGCSATPDCQWGMVYSGFGHGTKCKGGETLAADAKMRTLAAEVQGEVLVDSNNYVYYTNYASAEQTKTNSLAAQGKNYKQILLEMYKGASDIKKMSCSDSDGNSCTGGPISTGEYSTWKQYGAPWSNIPVGGGGTIRSIGCAATSISMLIAKSGVSTIVDGKFNPGSFVKKLNSTGGFDSSGNITWGKATDVAPNFKFAGDEKLSGSKQQKLNKIKSLLDGGYYVLVNVNNGGHWVAIDTINNGKVIMMDPGSSSNDLWSEYSVSSTIRTVYYKAS